MKSFPEVSKETLRIENYLQSLPEGHLVTFDDIAENAEVKMDERGKAYMRTACKRLKIEYEAIKSVGIRLASESSASTIVVHKICRIDNAVKRGEKTHSNIKTKFYDRLTDSEKKGLDLFGYAFSVIRSGANYGKKILKAKIDIGNFKPPEIRID